MARNPYRRRSARDRARMILLLALAAAISAWSLPLPRTAAAPPAAEPKPPPAAAPPPARGTGEREVRLSIDDAIRIALANNLDVRVEELARDRARSDIEIANASFDPLFATSWVMTKFRSPTVDFLSGVTGGTTAVVAVNPFTRQAFDAGISGLFPTGTTYRLTVQDERSDTPESSFFGINPRNETTVRADLTQPLLKNLGFDANLADRIQAENRDRIAELRRDRLLETTVAAVHDAYWNLVFAREDLRVKEEALVEAQQLLEINRQKAEVGTGKALDVIDAEANIETQRSGVIEGWNALRKAQDTLLDILNFRAHEDAAAAAAAAGGASAAAAASPLYQGLVIVPTSAPSDAAYGQVLAEAIEVALANREDLKQAELEVRNAEVELARRNNQLLPNLSLTGSWTQSGLDEEIGESVEEFSSGRYYDWSFGITLEYPLGNRRERNLAFQSKNDLASRRFSLEKLRNRVILDVTQGIRDIESAYQRLQSTRAATRLRTEQLRGETERLRVGSSTSYQVLQIQNDLLEARSREVRAMVDYKLAITAFESTIGRGAP